MSDNRSGLGKLASEGALEAGAAISPADREAEAVADLFEEELGREDGGALGERSRERAKRRRGQRGPNKTTTALRKYLMARYRNPLFGLHDIAEEDPAMLAHDLGCDPLDVFRLQVQCLATLAEYWQPKMPRQIQVDGIEAPVFNINLDGQAIGGVGMPTLPETLGLTKSQMISGHWEIEGEEVPSHEVPLSEETEMKSGGYNGEND